MISQAILVTDGSVAAYKVELLLTFHHNLRKQSKATETEFNLKMQDA